MTLWTIHPNITLIIEPSVIILYFFSVDDNNHNTSRTKNFCFMTIITNINQIIPIAYTTKIILSRIDFFNKTTTTQTTKPNITFGQNVFLYGFLNLFMGYNYNHILCTQNFCLVEIQQINIATTPTFYTISNPCNGPTFHNFTNITIMAN